jgi:hypothetical protein
VGKTLSKYAGLIGERLYSHLTRLPRYWHRLLQMAAQTMAQSAACREIGEFAILVKVSFDHRVIEGLQSRTFAVVRAPYAGRT